MEGIPSSVANNIAQRLVDRAIEEARYLFCFNSIREDFENEKEKLIAKRNIVEKDIQDARKRNATRIEDDVELWVKKVDGLIKKETSPKTYFYDWCPNCISRYSQGKQLARYSYDIPKLIDEASKFETIARPTKRPGMDFHSSPNFIHFESRKVVHEELLEALKDGNNYIIGLQGMGGAGKSTLAIEVGNEVEKKGLFDKVIFVVVSNPADVKKIRADIARQLDIPLKEGQESEHSEMLWSRIANSKEKILIILDDVWEAELSLKEIGIPLDDHHKGCSVLLTTRDSRVCELMGCQKSIRLDILSDEEAWDLFQKQAGISADDDSLEGVARDIARECKGLPVAIVAVARTFKCQDLALWKTALTTLRNSKPFHKVDEKLIDIYKCLNFSYENLRSEKAKRLFLLCSLFPEDYEIPTEDLITFSVGLGLFGEVEDYNSARGQALAARKDLIDSSLLLKEAKRGCVKMHDLVREVAHWIANKDGQVIMEVKSNQMHLARKERNIKYLFCGDMADFSGQFDGTQLEILLFNMDPKEYSLRVPDAFFERMTQVRVLLLEGIDRDGCWLSLPQTIQALKNIRTLALREWRLGDISVLENLQSLEALELAFCSIRNLPYNFTELKKLRLLRLRFCIIENNNPFAVIERCRQLEELDFTDLQICWPHDSKNDSESFCEDNTPPLHRYHLIGVSTKSNQWGDTMLRSWLKTYAYLYSETYYSTSGFLLIDGVDACFSEQTFKYLIRRADMIHLRSIQEKWTNLIPDIVPLEDECMNDLIKLRMDSCSGIRCLINCEHLYSHVRAIFSNLDEIELTNMENLEALYCGPLPCDNFLKKLKVLTIKKCLRLKIVFFMAQLNLGNLKVLKLEKCSITTLFLPSTARSLELLEELEIIECSDLKYIIMDEQTRDETEEDDDNKRSYGSVFPKLKALHIQKCNGLKLLLPVLSSAELLLLESIKICDCEELEYIFGQYQHEKEIILPSLKTIELSAIPKYISVFPDHCHPIKSSSIQGSCATPRRNSSMEKQPDPVRRNTFPWDHLCCSYLLKGEPKSSTASTNIQVDLNTSQTDRASQLYPAVSSASKIEQGFTFGTAQYLLRQPLNQYNIITLVLKSFPKLKSLFTLSAASRMIVEDLTVEECHELKHIVEEKGNGDPMNYSSIFPKLKHLTVRSCRQLKYILPATFSGGFVQLNWMTIDDAPELNYVFATYDHCDPLSQQSQNVEIHVDLPDLKRLDLKNLPNMVNMCSKSIYLKCPSLQCFYLKGLPPLKNKSFFDFILCSDPRQQDSTSSKKSKEIVAYETQMGNEQALQIIQSLDDVDIEDCKLEAIFQSEGLQTNGQPHLLTSHLTYLGLSDLPELSYICKGPTQFLSFAYLKYFTVTKCGKLKSIFSRSIVKSLPQLGFLGVTQCEELEQLVEPIDENNPNFSNPHSLHVCFPMLDRICIEQCNRLAHLFSINSPNDLPRLRSLEIKECSTLHKVFVCQQSNGHLITFPKLGVLILQRLPELIEVCQGFKWRAEYEEPVDCPKLTLLSETAISNALDVSKHLSSTNYGAPSANVDPVPEFQATHQHKSGSPNFAKNAKQAANDMNGGKVPTSEIMTKESPSAEPKLCFGEIEESRDPKGPISQNVIKATHLTDSEPSNSPGPSIIPPQNTCPQEGKVLKGELDFKEEEAVGKNETTEGVDVPSDIVQCDKATAYVSSSNALATSLTIHAMNVREIGGPSVHKNPRSTNAIIEPPHEMIEKISKSEPVLKEQEALSQNMIPQGVEKPFDVVQHIKQPANERFSNGLSTLPTIQELEGSPLPLIIQGTFQEGLSSEKDSKLRSSKYSELGTSLPSLSVDSIQSTKNSEETSEVPAMATPSNDLEGINMPSTSPIADSLHKTSSHNIKRTGERQSLQEHQELRKADIATLSTNSESKNPSLQQLAIPEQRSKESKNEQTGTNIGNGCDLQTNIAQYDKQTADERCRKALATSFATNEICGSPISSCTRETSTYSKLWITPQDSLVSCQPDLGKISMGEPILKEQEALGHYRIPQGDDKPSDLLQPTNESSSTGLSISPTIQEMEGLALTLMSSSDHSQLTGSSLSNPRFVSLSEASPQDQMRFSQIETHNDDDDDLIRLIRIMEEGCDIEVAMPSISAIAAEHVAVEDDLLAKAFADLEATLKMPLIEIASSNNDSSRLENALSILSNHCCGDGATSDGLKATIDSMHHEFESIVSSFKEASTKIGKFKELEEIEKSNREKLPRRKEAAVTLISEIRKTEKSKFQAQLKEAELQEQISRLHAELKTVKNEIKDCEVKLSSLREQKKKHVAETIGFMKEFETIRKDRSQIAEDETKARQELDEVDNKWTSCSASLRKTAVMLLGEYLKQRL